MSSVSGVWNFKNVATVIFAIGLLTGVAHAEKPQLPQLMATAKAPEWTASRDRWINTKGEALHLYGKAGIGNGRVVVLTFWTHGCINCKRTLPFWNDWAKQYHGTDVAVVSVHTPETDFERVPANVRRFVNQRGLTFPVVIDNDSALWNAYNVQAWPTTILIDKHGRIRQRWEGELDYEHSGEYKKVSQAIEALRQEK